MYRIIAFSVFVLGSVSAFAQSSVQLNTYSLDDPSSNTSEMETCLLDKANCKNDEYKETLGYSINQALEFKIIDREDVKTNLTSTEANTTLPSINIEILFNYNSAEVRYDQYDKIGELSNVLQGSKFSKFRFVLLGHTDAKGGAGYNQRLSQLRANSVAQLLQEGTGLSYSRFIAKGLGESQLKYPLEPLAPQNRRVQLLLIPG
jgi:outer membrane protein OmpA-like peptidoglycan-associated protein